MKSKYCITSSAARSKSELCGQVISVPQSGIKSVALYETLLVYLDNFQGQFWKRRFFYLITALYNHSPRHCPVHSITLKVYIIMVLHVVHVVLTCFQLYIHQLQVYTFSIFLYCLNVLFCKFFKYTRVIAFYIDPYPRQVCLILQNIQKLSLYTLS